ncbi:MAG: hypothetical protein J0L56_06705 [Chitinophagales bacterium]|nr:hypothetical protein [Chitinophagales bacterium]
MLAVLAAQYPAEKIFIHYDKESYIAGETIWFKAYFSSNGLPSGISSNFYIRLADDKGHTIAEKKYPVTGAAAKGNIDLPDSLPQGNYYFTATTAGMLTYGNDFIYRKNIYIYNPSAVEKITPAPQNIKVQFFPESGNLVDGLLTVVAFKATDAGGNPVEVSGVIRNEEGTTIASFKSYHDGMGRVQFKPQLSKKYKAEVDYNGNIHSFNLPEVVSSGINLKIQDEPGGIAFTVSRSVKDKSAFENVTLAGVMNNQVVNETEIAFDNYMSVKGHVLTDSLPSGILHFTVFNKDGLPLAERLSFVNNREYISAGNINTVKYDSARRAMNSFEINFPASIQRSLSVAVTDASSGGSGDKENIWSAFLLSGDLKGYIHNPAWYFEGTGDTAALAMDNLMLTHGWVRFNWKELLTGNLKVKKAREPYLLSVTGLVNDEQDKQHVSGGKLSIYQENEDSTSQSYEIPVAQDGRFVIDSTAFNGKANFFYVYSSAQGKQKPVKIHIDPITREVSLPDDAANLHFYPNNLSKAVKEQYGWMRNREKIKELANVTVESKTAKKPFDVVNEKYTTGVFRAPGKVNLDNINLPANDKSLNVMDWIRNSITHVELQGNRFVSRKNFSLGTGQKWAVGVFIDEAPADASQLRSLRVDEIALVKYYEAGFIGVGSGSPGGAIAVYTKKKDNGQQPDKLEYFTSNGYAIVKEFYNPDYSNSENNSQITDRRRTLYWSPDIYTDSETKTVNIKFYNSDVSKKFRVIIEGFDVNGKLIHLEKVIGD